MVAQTFQGKQAQEIEENQKWQAYGKADDEETKYESFLLTLDIKSFLDQKLKQSAGNKFLSIAGQIK